MASTYSLSIRQIGHLGTMTNLELFSPHIRQINTYDLESLASFHVNKNRQYTQLKAGKFSAHVTEISLGNAHIMKESMTVGSRIEAAPAKNFLPFAFVLPKSLHYKFCGQTPSNNAFIQASGGSWELLFNHQLEYLCSVFEREYFIENYELLMGKAVPSEFLASRISQSTQSLNMHYAQGISQLMQYILTMPQLVIKPEFKRLFCNHLLQLTISALSPSIDNTSTLKPASKRQKGVTKALEYINEYAHYLPDMSQLCKVSELSERSLQYGFSERLGMTPIKYLRTVRLNKAHCALIKANKQQISVAKIALDWGFVEFGRFAREYKTLFHELPSQTLANN